MWSLNNTSIRGVSRLGGPVRPEGRGRVNVGRTIDGFGERFSPMIGALVIGGGVGDHIGVATTLTSDDLADSVWF